MGLNVLGVTNATYCNVVTLPIVTKDPHISPRFSPYEFLSSALIYNSTIVTFANHEEVM